MAVANLRRIVSLMGLLGCGGSCDARVRRGPLAQRVAVRLCAPSRATMRYLSLDDLDAVVELDSEAHSPGLWTREQYAAEIEGDRVFAVGAFSEVGLLLGMIFMSTVLDEAMLTNLAVARAVRRRGLATRLLDAALADGRKAGVQLFVLEVRQANRAAQKLYLSRGFVQAGRRRGYYQQPRDDAAVLLLRQTEEEMDTAERVAALASVGCGAAMPSQALQLGVEFELPDLWRS